MATLHDNNIKLDFILICDTLLHNSNTYFYELPGYSFVIDLAVVVEGEFESISIETTNTPKTQ